MKRREFFVAAIGSLLIAGAPVHAGEPLTVIYVGAKDCPPCQRFDRWYKQAFVFDVVAKGMNFREIKVETLRDIRQASAWPNDLKWLLTSLGSEAGVPWFFTVDGHRLVSETQSYETFSGGG
jgi:hypothetical protein